MKAKVLLLDVAFRLIQFESGRMQMEFRIKDEWGCPRAVSQNEYEVTYRADAEEWQSRNKEQIIERD